MIEGHSLIRVSVCSGLTRYKQDRDVKRQSVNRIICFFNFNAFYTEF